MFAAIVYLAFVLAPVTWMFGPFKAWVLLAVADPAAGRAGGPGGAQPRRRAVAERGAGPDRDAPAGVLRAAVGRAAAERLIADTKARLEAEYRSRHGADARAVRFVGRLGHRRASCCSSRNSEPRTARSATARRRRCPPTTASPSATSSAALEDCRPLLAAIRRPGADPSELIAALRRAWPSCPRPPRRSTWRCGTWPGAGPASRCGGCSGAREIAPVAGKCDDRGAPTAPALPARPRPRPRRLSLPEGQGGDRRRRRTPGRDPRRRRTADGRSGRCQRRLVSRGGCGHPEDARADRARAVRGAGHAGWRDSPSLAAQTPVALALDETSGAPGALDRRHAQAVCLKITRWGGISGLLAAARRAKTAGYEVYLGLDPGRSAGNRRRPARRRRDQARSAVRTGHAGAVRRPHRSPTRRGRRDRRAGRSGPG